ncbi:hypothetical protein AALP_AA5G036900 [Arabis alpina]|uniref:F-box domain-containing protein n=1 Tax=Arabis alpina TaxID=50452 RepID=A0A087GUR3_ARAAL|nr:hypothetical protein AALP_AA5G036900 [Arabis alpina]
MKRCLRNEDRISHLPEALLVHILSMLSTKDVVATSALSKQWKSLWKIVPKIKLELIGMSIGIAYARHLRELVLDVRSEIGNFTFPSSLYNCKTLETLILRNWVLLDVPSPVCLKSLRTLHLDDVNYKDDASVVNLLSGCPNLENLVVYRGDQQDVKLFIIAVPSLQRLTIYDGYNWYGVPDEDIGGYVINAPCLKYLKIQGFLGLQFRLIENALELVDADIINVSITIDQKLLESLTSVKRLSLTSSPLELSTHKVEWWNLLLVMLDSSPKLQVLKLISEKYCVEKHMACEKWNQRKNVSECLIRHLETFVWNGYTKQLEKEKEVAKYILRNANHLKRATISVRDLNSDERLEMLEELESVARASKSSCKLLLLSE